MADAGDARVKSEGETSKQTEYDPRLDFYSEHFDPLLALKTPGILPPHVDAKEYDNLHAYENAWKKQGTSGQNKTVEITETGEVPERKWLPHQRKLDSGEIYDVIWISKILQTMLAHKNI